MKPPEKMTIKYHPQKSDLRVVFYHHFFRGFHLLGSVLGETKEMWVGSRVLGKMRG